MKKLILVLQFLLYCSMLFAQKSTVSSEIVEYSGTKYIKHIVGKNESLLKISKLYDVKESAIIAKNTSALLGLFQGQVVFIPYPENYTKLFQSEKQVSFINHTIKRGETAYSLSKKYGISLDRLYAYNTTAESGLKTGEKLKIPKQENDPDPEPFLVEDDRFIYKKIEVPNQTLFLLSRSYNAKLDELKKVNANLSDNLRIGDIVKIPKQKTIDDIVVEAEKYTAENTFFFDDPLFYVNPEVPCDTLDYEENTVTFKVALFLPFFLDENENIGLYSKSKPEENTFFGSSQAILEFYEGILLAFNTLQQSGIYAELHVFDTERDSAKVYSIIESEKLDEMDLIIAPVHSASYMLTENTINKLSAENISRDVLSKLETIKYNYYAEKHEFRQALYNTIGKDKNCIFRTIFKHAANPDLSNLRIIADFARQSRINLISPFTRDNELVSYNPYVFQISPSLSTLIDKTSKYIARNYFDSNILIVHKGATSDLDIVEKYKKSISRYLLEDDPLADIQFKEINFKTGGIKAVKSALSDQKENIIIIPYKEPISKEEEEREKVFITEFLMKTNSLTKNHTISVFGSRDWEKYINIETLKYLYNLNTHTYSTSYVNYENEKVHSFVYKFRQAYKSEPGYLGFYGYDMTYYFINALKKYGRNFHYCLEASKIEGQNGLQTGFSLTRIDNFGGFENKRVSILKYNQQFDIEKVE